MITAQQAYAMATSDEVRQAFVSRLIEQANEEIQKAISETLTGVQYETNWMTIGIENEFQNNLKLLGYWIEVDTIEDRNGDPITRVIIEFNKDGVQ